MPKYAIYMFEIVIIYLDNSITKPVILVWVGLSCLYKPIYGNVTGNSLFLLKLKNASEIQIYIHSIRKINDFIIKAKHNRYICERALITKLSTILIYLLILT